MYEQVSHAALNRILERLKPEIRKSDMPHFYTRLGANFYAIHSLFFQLYGQRADFEEQLVRLVEVMAAHYINRDASLKQLDSDRENDHNWFLHQRWVGMAIYADGFAGTIEGVSKKIDYLQELGVNMLHIMPMLKCPAAASDGGYAVSDFRDVDERFGTLKDIRVLARKLRRRSMLLTLDVVVNHSSNEHAWAKRARAGDKTYQDYYFIYPDRRIPDQYEASMPEIFPETAPDNFTFDDQMQSWVMTVFNTYQWDLNYQNPAVFIEMLDVILFWANQGADIVRLDAVAFLWKQIGTNCQNLPEAHLILQVMKDCCQVTAPGVLFIAEAIVAPMEIAKYFGEDAIIAKECEIAYNATLMALLWDAVATKNARLLNQGVASLPSKLERATWLNYIRCHDDIGLGFDDQDIRQAGYEPAAHRRFLLDWLTGQYADSPSRGQPFGRNLKTGDARISGALASLVGLETAIANQDEAHISLCIDTILLLHGVIMAFGGMPLLYYGDEIGTLNDCSYQADQAKSYDNRWMHRPRIDWAQVQRRKKTGTVQQRIFSGVQRLIGIRARTPAFADFNNRELLNVGNAHVLAFLRGATEAEHSPVLALFNFDHAPQTIALQHSLPGELNAQETLLDLASGYNVELIDGQLQIPPCGFYWLTDPNRH
jgi:amylosucrase